MPKNHSLLRVNQCFCDKSIPNLHELHLYYSFTAADLSYATTHLEHIFNSQLSTLLKRLLLLLLLKQFSLFLETAHSCASVGALDTSYKCTCQNLIFDYKKA